METAKEESETADKHIDGRCTLFVKERKEGDVVHTDYACGDITRKPPRGVEMLLLQRIEFAPSTDMS